MFLTVDVDALISPGTVFELVRLLLHFNKKLVNFIFVNNLTL